MIEYGLQKTPSSNKNGMRILMVKGIDDTGDWHSVGSIRTADAAREIRDILNQHHSKEAIQ